MDNPNTSPINPLPAVVWILVLPMIAMEIVISAGTGGLVGGPTAIGWRLEALQRFAFAPQYMRMMLETNSWPLDGVMRLFTYPVVSFSTTETVFVVVLTLALGKFVGEVFRWWAILALFMVGSVAGALAYSAVPGTQVALAGGYPGVYALIGGFTWLLWRHQRAMGHSQVTAFQLIGFLLLIRIVFGIGGLMFPGASISRGMDWVAELAGFAAGFALSFLVSPGGWAGLHQRMRGR